jgi:hypothetical protein
MCMEPLDMISESMNKKLKVVMVNIDFFNFFKNLICFFYIFIE